MSIYRILLCAILTAGSFLSISNAGIINPKTDLPMTRENVSEFQEECGTDLGGCDDEEKEEMYEEDVDEQDEEIDVWFEAKGITIDPLII